VNFLVRANFSSFVGGFYLSFLSFDWQAADQQALERQASRQSVAMKELMKFAQYDYF
jgi:hypothetical protein